MSHFNFCYNNNYLHIFWTKILLKLNKQKHNSSSNNQTSSLTTNYLINIIIISLLFYIRLKKSIVARFAKEEGCLGYISCRLILWRVVNCIILVMKK